MSSVTFVNKSSNKKVGNIAVTYAPINPTCPDTCELKNNGCYAELSFVGMINKRLEKDVKNSTPTEIAKMEAELIDNSFKGSTIPSRRPLRLHVSGDTKTRSGARYLSAAAKRWLSRQGGPVFTYTHAWKVVPRKSWSNVSILASVDSIKDANKAFKEGYAPAIVVTEFPKNKAFQLKGSKIKFLPCPAQLKEDINCEKCKLCMKADWLHENKMGIAFAIHSNRKEKMKLKILDR